MLRFFLKPRLWRGHFSDLRIAGLGEIGMDSSPDSDPMVSCDESGESLDIPGVDIAIVGDPHGEDTAALHDAAASLEYDVVRIKVVDPADEVTLAELGYTAGDSARAYVCIGAVCLPPVDEPGDLTGALEEFMRPSALQVDSILKRLED